MILPTPLRTWLGVSRAATFPWLYPEGHCGIASLFGHVCLRIRLTIHRGNPGDEVLDDQFNFSNARRRSNSSGYANNLQDFKTKFELNEVEPVFEEHMADPDEELTKMDSASTSGASADENSAKSV